MFKRDRKSAVLLTSCVCPHSPLVYILMTYLFTPVVAVAMVVWTYNLIQLCLSWSDVSASGLFCYGCVGFHGGILSPLDLCMHLQGWENEHFMGVALHEWAETYRWILLFSVLHVNNSEVNSARIAGPPTVVVSSVMHTEMGFSSSYVFLFHHSHTKCEVYFPTSTDSPTPIECPIIQFSSDWNTRCYCQTPHV